MANATPAVTGQALISATGVATFAAADDTFLEMLTAIDAAQAATGAAARSAAVFTFGGNNYLYTGDGAGLAAATGYVVQLAGTTIATGITLTGGDITAIA